MKTLGVAVMLTVAVLAGRAFGADANVEPKEAPIYVGAWSVDHEWKIVTPEVLEELGKKRILYGSRSWGLVIGGYVSRTAKAIKWEGGGKLRVTDADRVLTGDAFKDPKIINYIFDTEDKRFTYMDDYLRKEPWKFGEKIDGVIQTLYYISDKKDFQETYFPMLDKEVKDFPKIKFAVATHDVNAVGTNPAGKVEKEDSTWNIRGGDYSDAVIKRYYGKLPIFDMRDIVSTKPDGTAAEFEKNGKKYRYMVREYARPDGDLIHPNSEEGTSRLGKGFLILMAKMFCADKIPKDLPPAPKPEILKESSGGEKK